MATTLSAATRHDLLLAIRERYVGGTRDERIRILDEFVAVTGYQRKHVIRLFTAKAVGSRDTLTAARFERWCFYRPAEAEQILMSQRCVSG